MCIVFLYVNNNPLPGTYQVIVAVNRDEYFRRPTEPAKFWSGNCISGLDLEPGKEGGTWFGTSTGSKTGALLNILESSPDRDKLGRGHLVTDFLTGTEDAATYINRIASQRHSYNAFNLVLLERKDSGWSVHYCSSEDDTTPRKLQTGVLVFGNSVYNRPWKKVVYGKDKFEKIVASNNSVCNNGQLKEALMNMLADRTSHLPDPQLASQSPPKLSSTEILSARSSIFVDLAKQFNYGTRTHTVLLIDSDGHCEYVEKTLSDFSDVTNQVWKTVTHEYNLNSEY